MPNLALPDMPSHADPGLPDPSQPDNPLPSSSQPDMPSHLHAEPIPT